MKKTIISYSLSGNNDKLATSIASLISAEHFRIIEKKRRRLFTIGLDMVFNRTPKVPLKLQKLEDHEIIIFIAPVWMGQVASPLRNYFKALKNKINNYVFISISGGADGPNPNLEAELLKRLGKKPASIINMLIADILPADPKPTREMIGAYLINPNDAKILAGNCLSILENKRLL